MTESNLNNEIEKIFIETQLIPENQTPRFISIGLNYFPSYIWICR
jgi:hypothetical protein